MKNQETKKIRADLHNHFTTLSRVLDVNKVADTVRERLGKGGICALVNYDDRRFEAFAERAEPYGNRLGNAVYFPDRDVLIVKGEEIPTQKGDLLVLAIGEGVYLTPMKSVSDSVKEAKEKGGVVIAPHPYFHSKIGEVILEDLAKAHYQSKELFRKGIVREQEGYLKDISGVEVHNGNASKRANIRANTLLKKARTGENEIFMQVPNTSYRWGAISSSDGHSFWEVESSHTFLQMPSPVSINNAPELVRSLDEAVRNSVRLIIDYPDTTSVRTTSYIGAAIHMVSLMPFFIPIIRKILSRGDQEALR